MNLHKVAFVVLLIALCADGFAGGKGGGGSVAVRGFVRKDGTYVPPHQRSAPDGNFGNNWSTEGNVNPYTGEDGKVTNPPHRSAPGVISIPSTYSTPTIPTDSSLWQPLPAPEGPSSFSVESNNHNGGW